MTRRYPSRAILLLAILIFWSVLFVFRENEVMMRRQGTNQDISVAIVAIISMPRSSSTHVKNLIRDLPCGVGLNEIFYPGNWLQSGDAWQIDGKELRRKDKSKVPPEEWADFLLAVARRRCQNKIGPSCQGKCIAAYKHFGFDEYLPWNASRYIWRNLPNTTHVILNRDVESRWRSFYHAERTLDWSVKGSKWHKWWLKHETIPPVAEDFIQEQNSWYRFVNESLDGLPRVLYMSYDEAIAKDGQLAFETIRQALPPSFQSVTFRGFFHWFNRFSLF